MHNTLRLTYKLLNILPIKQFEFVSCICYSAFIWITADSVITLSVLFDWIRLLFSYWNNRAIWFILLPRASFSSFYDKACTCIFDWLHNKISRAIFCFKIRLTRRGTLNECHTLIHSFILLPCFILDSFKLTQETHSLDYGIDSKHPHPSVSSLYSFHQQSLYFSSVLT